MFTLVIDMLRHLPKAAIFQKFLVTFSDVQQVLDFRRKNCHSESSLEIWLRLQYMDA